MIYENCTACCPADTVIIPGCCGGVGIPTTLHVTISNVLGCLCVDGLVVTITWNGSTGWIGSATINCDSGRNTQVWFSLNPCNVGSSWTMDWWCGTNPVTPGDG